MSELEEKMRYGLIPISQWQKTWVQTHRKYLQTKQQASSLQTAKNLLTDTEIQLKKEKEELEQKLATINEKLGKISKQMADSEATLSQLTSSQSQLEKNEQHFRPFARAEKNILSHLQSIVSSNKLGTLSVADVCSLLSIFDLSYLIDLFSSYQIDGKYFMNITYFDLRKNIKILNLRDRYFLLYIKHMLENNVFPADDHRAKCLVCQCASPIKLSQLLKEHLIAIDYEALITKEIDGPAFVMIPPEKLIKYFVNYSELVIRKSTIQKIQAVTRAHFLLMSQSGIQ